MALWVVAVLIAAAVIVSAVWWWLTRYSSVVFIALEPEPGRFVVARVHDKAAGFTVQSTHESLEAARQVADAMNQGRRVTYADIDAVSAASLARGPLVERV